ncbi:hypothetical protein MRY87_12875 [bacterium]|nr:hypothetical protein [bacterium]
MGKSEHYTRHHAELQPEQREFLHVLQRLLRSEVPLEYLYGRAEAPIGSDSPLWVKLCELGLFEYFQEISSEDRPFSMLGELARITGATPLPEPLLESLLAGPLLLQEIATTEDQERIEKMLGSQSTPVRNGEALIAVLPPMGNARLADDGELFGILLSEKTAGCVVMKDEGLVFISLSGSTPSSSSRTSLDRLLPRGVVSVDAGAGKSLVDEKEKKGVAFADSPCRRFRAAYSFLYAAELLGMGEEVIARTAEYVTDRKQFGIAVGCFQAVQHPLAEAYLKVKELESLVLFTADALDRRDSQAELLSKVSLAAAVQRVPAVLEKCLQLHGGIGFTWEYPLHYFLRRAQTYAALFPLTAEDERQIQSMSAAL